MSKMKNEVSVMSRPFFFLPLPPSSLPPSAARGPELCFSEAGVQGHWRGDAASRLWRLQRVHICIRADRSGQKLHYDGTTGTGPAGNYSSGKSPDRHPNITVEMSNNSFLMTQIALSLSFSCVRTFSPKSMAPIPTTTCPTQWRSVLFPVSTST